MPGDPLKNLDWKVWARSDRYLIKQYSEETNLRCHLLVDLSGSMGFKSPRAAMSKIEYAQSLAAALGYLMLHQQDAVGLLLFADRPLTYVPARAVRSHLDVILKTLAASAPQGRTRLGPALHELAERIKRRGLVVRAAASWTNPPCLALQHFRHRHHEVIISSSTRTVEFPYTDTATFVDLEGGASPPGRGDREGYASAWRRGPTTAAGAAASTGSTTSCSIPARRSTARCSPTSEGRG
jgi:uncharacterized protein (DUF58 family)